MNHERMRPVLPEWSRRWVMSVFLLALAGWANAEIVEGREYVRLAEPLPRASAADIEVLEFFSYGCGACAVFQPTLTQWATALPPGVRLIRVPTTMGRAKWQPLARTYYALQKIGHAERLDAALFEAIHQQKVELFDEQSIVAWVATQGVNADEFQAALRSPEIADEAARAEQLARAYGVDRTPMLGVDGKYVIRAKKKLTELTDVADQLVARLQAERAPK
jgi:protein dithiol oxidoreductase (disulfide-forming)